MATIASRRPVMTLYSGPACPYSHRVRLVLAEKGISAEVIDVDGGTLPEDLVELNPYGSLPTLFDRDLVLYNAQIIAEYLDERYPHPPLMPVDPVARARTKLYIHRIERDWMTLLDQVAQGDDGQSSRARKDIRDSLTVIAPIFGQKPFFMSDEFSLVDCALAPLLWRLECYDIELPPQAQALQSYAERLFARAGFRDSLTPAEREMHRL